MRWWILACTAVLMQAVHGADLFWLNTTYCQEGES
jgi:hypothetical protein